MNICITIPSFAIHGGIRILMEWANRLSKWHRVTILMPVPGKCEWFHIHPEVSITSAINWRIVDCLIIGSPHAVDLLEAPVKKKFVFCQMAEHLFNTSSSWQGQCRKFYKAPVPMFSISRWNIEDFKKMGRLAETHYIGNGVNLEDFPISTMPKDNKTVLVEGWEPGNPSKDQLYFGAKVAAKLKSDGYRILAYSQYPLKKHQNIPDEYYQCPSLQVMNDLYERATILIKASRFDARSCAPMEAMTKGTVTARAIIKGDDDLIHMSNSLVSGYNINALYNNALLLLNNQSLRNELSYNCIEYVQKYNWDYWMKKINEILCSD